MTVWKIAPGRNASEWEWMRNNGFVAVSWLNRTDLRKFSGTDEILNVLRKNNDGDVGSAASIVKFLGIAKGDTVVANRGLSEVVGIGRVISDYLPPGAARHPYLEYAGFRQAYRVEWVIDSPVNLRKRVFNQPTVQQLTIAQVEWIRRCYLKAFPGVRKQLDELFGDARIQNDESLIDALGEETSRSKYRRSADDERSFVLRQIANRRGQRFRRMLRNWYEDYCMVTGCRILSILEAAHIDPYRGGSTDHLDNGLLLRADVHTLFDLELIGFEPETLVIELHPALATDETYRSLAGRKLRCPQSKRPAREPLRRRYRKFKKRSLRPL